LRTFAPCTPPPAQLLAAIARSGAVGPPPAGGGFRGCPWPHDGRMCGLVCGSRAVRPSAASGVAPRRTPAPGRLGTGGGGSAAAGDRGWFSVRALRWRPSLPGRGRGRGAWRSWACPQSPRGGGTGAPCSPLTADSRGVMSGSDRRPGTFFGSSPYSRTLAAHLNASVDGKDAAARWRRSGS